MKKKTIRLLGLLLCLILTLQLAPVSAWAGSEAPYETYTNDKWGNAVLSPNGYLPVESLDGVKLGCGGFSNASDMFYNDARGELYIVDSGNKRIVVLSDRMEYLREITALVLEDGSEYAFSDPQGIFVKNDGTMFIAERGNRELISADPSGNVITLFPTPTSNLLPDGFIYRPKRVVVDQDGRIYVVSEDVFQGIMYLEPDGSFIKFFGPNEVEMTRKRRMMKIWKTILNDTASGTLEAFNPIEYGNLFLGKDGYIYATSAGKESSNQSSSYLYEVASTDKSRTKLMTKLNPVGIDCWPTLLNSGRELYSDVTVDENGIISLLDVLSGKICQYTENGVLLFNFGGTGEQCGLFQQAVSIVEINDNLYVLDSAKSTITEFSLTEFGKLVRQAISLYDEGMYRESIEPWKEVVRRDSNFLLAYTGLGKAYYQLKEYETAMYYYKLANDRENYSVAFREVSLIRMRASFGWIVLGIAAVTVLIIALKQVFDRVDFSRLRKKKATPPSAERKE